MCSLSVLVVDDHPVNRLLLCWQLSELGHRTIAAEDGHEGLERWLAQPFDVVITDCNMPRRNGYELARAIRDEEAASDRAPSLLIGFTANAQVEEKVRCIDAGMDECLFKPIRLHDLQQALTGASQCDSGVEPVEGTTLTEIDLSALEQMAGNDHSMIDRLRAEVLRSLHHDLQRLDDLNHEHDSDGLRELAHHIKGGAQMVGAARVVSACAVVEKVMIYAEAVAVSSRPRCARPEQPAQRRHGEHSIALIIPRQAHAFGVVRRWPRSSVAICAMSASLSVRAVAPRLLCRLARLVDDGITA